MLFGHGISNGQLVLNFFLLWPILLGSILVVVAVILIVAFATED